MTSNEKPTIDGNVYQVRKVYSHALMRKVEELVVTGTVDVTGEAPAETVDDVAVTHLTGDTAAAPQGVVAKAKAKVKAKSKKRAGKKNT